ncbi:MipA/OmpV family protein [uncultured Albimonas sp.]|uniref:MipA/OmpV family protein n=1 Tax=uncultured Albimonas sp. TaxID=1331701 RepID=UPI0030EB67DC
MTFAHSSARARAAARLRAGARALLLLSAGWASPALAGGDFPIPIPLDHLPNAVAVGVGFAPTWLGSDDYFLGGAPAASIGTPLGRLNVMGNYAALNLLEERFDRSGWRFGPAVVYRFGRSDVDDPVVARLPEVDDSLEIGANLGYQFVDAANPVRRLNLGADLTFDVTQGDGAAALNLFARAVQPLPWPGGAAMALVSATLVNDAYAERFFSVSAAGSAASGLPIFEAGGPGRDVRVGVGMLQSLSPRWHLGAGVVYSRLVGDAADGPIVSRRGEADQLLFGLGLAYAWGFEG